MLKINDLHHLPAFNTVNIKYAGHDGHDGQQDLPNVRQRPSDKFN